MKGPHFFCEHCGAEVPRNADRCPDCGRYFSSVKCPKCGFVGAEDLFRGGCPVCGYSAPPSAGRPCPRDAGKPVSPGPLPLWVYLVTLSALVLTIAFALSYFLS